MSEPTDGPGRTEPTTGRAASPRRREAVRRALGLGARPRLRPRPGLSGLADQAADAVHDVDEHLATGAPSAPGARSAAPCTSYARRARRCAPTWPSRPPRCCRPRPGCWRRPCRRTRTTAGRARGERRATSTWTTTPGLTRALARGGRRMTLACGVDVGGTKIAGGVVDEDGTVLEELRVESPGHRRRGHRGGHRRAGQRAALPARRSRPSGSAPPATSTRRARSCCSRPTSPGATRTSRASSRSGSTCRS